MYLGAGSYVKVYLDENLEYAVVADHNQVAQLLGYVARRLGIRARWYVSQPGVASLAVADPRRQLIVIDENAADNLVVLHGECALLFVVLHELGHLKNVGMGGRAGERAADIFAASTLIKLGYVPSEVLRSAAASLVGTKDDGVHDAGTQRLELIWRTASRSYRLAQSRRYR
jgi:hypothetical protein